MNINYNNNNTIIFTLARMNPPTPGHLFLIQRLIEEAIQKNVSNVYIILSKTNDNNENPIPCSEKLNVLGNADDLTKTMIHSLKENMMRETTDEELKQKIQNVVVNTICVPEQKGATPFTAIIPIINSMENVRDINLFLIIGNDRQNMLDSITDYFLKWDNVNSVNGEILPREEMGEYKKLSSNPTKLETLNMSEVPLNAMSASFVRNIVKNKRKDKFTELYLPYLDEPKIDELYSSILNGLQTLPLNTKPDGPVKSLKYKYPMIKTAAAKKTTSSYRDDDDDRMVSSKKTSRKKPRTFGGRMGGRGRKRRTNKRRKRRTKK